MTQPKLDLQGMVQNDHVNNIRISTVHKDYVFSRLRTLTKQNTEYHGN